MRINRIGEFGLIDKIKKIVKTDKRLIRGIGDDCAVAEFDRDKYMLMTCDMLVEGVDFYRKDDPYLVGAKSLAVSISDIAANGGWPAYALICLGLPGNIDLSYARQLYRGMSFWAEKYKINIAGGDISKADKITLSVSLTGFVEKRRLILRSGARAGDIIFMSGKLGSAILDKRRLHVKPRLQEARYLAEHYRINSMIDISDGLPQDLHHITSESKVGAVIFQELVPFYREGKSFLHTVSLGEDFELLFTMSVSEAKKLASDDIETYCPIGEITDRKYGVRLIDGNHKEKPLKASGFRHF